ncbi:hypothetical protein CWE13_07790 [Aliidiomarina shirensis]|uniref:diguanylate cyclase n=1 Tax=Aliidiomarina shirensis TaxID=1048642 RepID=A0A432WSJ3_9GAMM|nr:GGDEF domain-containing protein [Aliidiomarina shirensis]RUO36742.1 hypothetical protein CWE13_07790 [Aliidiomarina shirensis]
MKICTKLGHLALISFFSCLIAFNTANAVDLVDPALEQELDSILGVGFYPEDREKLAELLERVTINVPASTYVRAWGYRALELAHAEQNFAEAEILAKELIRFARSAESVEAQAEAWAVFMEVLSAQGDNDTAVRYVIKLTPLVDEIMNPRIQFFVNNVAGRALQEVERYEEALGFFLQAQAALTRTRGVQTLRRRQFLNYHIANLHTDLENYRAGLDLTNSTIAEGERYEVHHRLADLYLLKGFLQSRPEIDENEMALDSFRIAAEWAERTDNARIAVVSRNNIGSILIQRERYTEAEEYLLAGVSAAENANMMREMNYLKFNLADIKVKRGLYAEGIEEMKTIALYMKEHARRSDHAEVLTFLSGAYREAGMYIEEADTLRELMRLRFDLLTSEREQMLSELAAEYEAREQDQQIELLEERNNLQAQVIENAALQRRIVWLFAIVLVLAATLLYYAYRSARKANVRLNTANEKLQEQTLRDPLTKLHNRRAMQKEMELRAGEHYPIADAGNVDALILLDLDLFKEINDRIGHAAGDEVLQQVATRLTHAVAEHDMVVRWGGEEFLIYVRNRNYEELANLADELLHVIGDTPVYYEQNRIPVSVTGGMITLPFADVSERECDWEKALQIADMLLYVGKLRGRNQISHIRKLTKPYAEIHEVLHRDLNQAIDKGWAPLTIFNGPK